MGIIMDPDSQKQKFFGGGVVDNKAKNVSNDKNAHTDDILAIKYNESTKQCVSGQVGHAPAAFLWDASSGEKVQNFKLPKGSRGVNAIAISADGKFIVCVDLHNDHRIHVFDTASGSSVWQENGDTAKIYDVAFTKVEGKHFFVTVGKKHIKFWDPSEKKCEKGLYGQGGPQTSFATCDSDEDGHFFAGSLEGTIY